MKVNIIILVFVGIAAIALVVFAVINIVGIMQTEYTQVGRGQLLDLQSEYAEYMNAEADTSQLQNDSRAYRYKENDGIFVFYETENEELYRSLLPAEFDMPDNMVVHLFIMDFYDIDSDADPYKEMSISLLAEYNNEEVWHCIYMPVTSEQSMIAGKVGLGLPKTLGDIQFIREDLCFTGNIVDNQNRSGTITVDTNEYTMSASEEKQIRSFMSLPKLNILNGEIIQMTTSNGDVNIIDVAKRYPNYVTVQGGQATVLFDSADSTILHPFDLEPSAMIAAYYMHNKIPFRLDRK